MKKLKLLLGLMILNLSVMGQTNEFYYLTDALSNTNKDLAKSLYLNYNFQEIKPISDSISELVNLEEFRIQSRWFDFPKIVDNQIISNKIDSSENKTPNSIPNEITKCQKLKLIDISNTEVNKLPEDFGQLENLERLILNYTQIDLNIELSQILKLKNLREIQLIGVDITQNQREKLKEIKNLKILATAEDFQNEVKTDESVDVQIHDTYMVFQNEEQANRFINSMPFGLAEKVKKYKKGDR